MFSFFKKLDAGGKQLLLTCYFALFCSGTVSLMMGSIIPDVQSTYGISSTVSGMFLSAHSIGNLVAGFISGLVPLVLGRKKSIIVLSCLSFLGYAMMVFWGNPIWLFIAFLMLGLGRGSITNFTNQHVNRLSGGSPAASNLLHASFAVGAIITPMIFLSLSGIIGWKAGCIYVVLVGCILQFAFSRIHFEDDRPSRKDKKNSTLRFVRNPSFLILALMMLCYLCSEYAINGWLVTYIQHKENLSAALVASGTSAKAFSQSMATLLWTVILIGRLICASLSGKVNQRLLMMISSVISVSFFALMLAAENTTMLTIAVGGLGFGMAGICPMIYSDAADFTNTFPMATSVLLCIGSVGSIAMPSLVGILADAYGFSGGMSAILVTMILLVIFSTMNLVMKRRPAEG